MDHVTKKKELLFKKTKTKGHLLTSTRFAVLVLPLLAMFGRTGDKFLWERRVRDSNDKRNNYIYRSKGTISTEQLFSSTHLTLFSPFVLLSLATFNLFETLSKVNGANGCLKEPESKCVHLKFSVRNRFLWELSFMDSNFEFEFLFVMITTFGVISFKKRILGTRFDISKSNFVVQQVLKNLT